MDHTLARILGLAFGIAMVKLAYFAYPILTDKMDAGEVKWSYIHTGLVEGESLAYIDDDSLDMLDGYEFALTYDLLLEGTHLGPNLSIAERHEVNCIAPIQSRITDYTVYEGLKGQSNSRATGTAVDDWKVLPEGTIYWDIADSLCNEVFSDD